MLAKRPLPTGWACASCDKELVNLQAKVAEYTPWQKIGQKSTSGQGFSKLLKSINPDIIDKIRGGPPEGISY